MNWVPDNRGGNTGHQSLSLELLAVNPRRKCSSAHDPGAIAREIPGYVGCGKERCCPTHRMLWRPALPPREQSQCLRHLPLGQKRADPKLDVTAVTREQFVCPLAVKEHLKTGFSHCLIQVGLSDHA